MREKDTTDTQDYQQKLGRLCRDKLKTSKSIEAWTAHEWFISRLFGDSEPMSAYEIANRCGHSSKYSVNARLNEYYKKARCISAGIISDNG